jgi:hypothetical protein
MSRFRGTTGSFDVAAILIGTTILLFAFQFRTLTKLSKLPPSLSFVTLGRFVDEVRKNVALDWVDGVLAVAIVMLCLAVVLLELWRKRLSCFLDEIFSSSSRTLWLLTISCVVFVRFYLAPGGLSWAGDASSHLAYAFITAQAMVRGELPIWTNYLGFGSPYIQLYGFLFFYLVGAIEMLLKNLDASLKLVLICSHVCSGIGMYAWVLAVTQSRRAGFIAGISIVLGFWHTQQVLFMGRLPLGLFYGLAPWPFFFLERSRGSEDAWPWLVGGGLALGLLAFTHPGYGFWITAFFGLYWVLRTLRDDHERGRGLLAGCTILAFGVLMGAFLTLGIWTEREGTHLAAGLHMSAIPDPTVGQVLGWSNFRFFLLPPDPFHWYGGYVGLSVAMIALTGLLLWRPLRQVQGYGPMLAGAVALLLSLLLVFGFRLSVLQAIPVVTALNAGRYLFFVLLFLSFMAGLGAHLILMRQVNPGGRTLAILIILIVLDLGPTTFQHPFRSTNSTPTGYSPELFEPFQKEAESYHRKDQIPNYRIVWLAPRVHPFMAMGRLVYKTGTPTPAAPSGHVLNTVPTFYWPFERFASALMQDIETGQFTELFVALRTGFALMNTRFVVATRTDDSLSSMEFRPRTEILVSPSVREYPKEQMDRVSDWESATLDDPERFPILWLARNMNVNFDESTCERIYLMEAEREEDLGTASSVEVLSHVVTNQKVEMRVRVSAVSFARLPYAYYPHLSVTTNGTEVPFMQTATRFIALKLEAGISEIVIEPRLSPLRRVLLWLDLILLAAGALVIWRSQRRRGRRTLEFTSP